MIPFVKSISYLYKLILSKTAKASSSPPSLTIDQTLFRILCSKIKMSALIQISIGKNLSLLVCFKTSLCFNLEITLSSTMLKHLKYLKSEFTILRLSMLCKQDAIVGSTIFNRLWHSSGKTASSIACLLSSGMLCRNCYSRASRLLSLEQISIAFRSKA